MLLVMWSQHETCNGLAQGFLEQHEHHGHPSDSACDWIDIDFDGLMEILNGLEGYGELYNSFEWCRVM